MKIWSHFFVVSALLTASCSFRHEALIDPTVREAEILGSVAKSRGLESASANATKQTAAARSLKDDREYEQAYAKADEALLNARLSLALSELAASAKADSLALAALRQEQQEQAAYQNILEERRAVRGGAQ